MPNPSQAQPEVVTGQPVYHALYLAIAKLQGKVASKEHAYEPGTE